MTPVFISLVGSEIINLLKSKLLAACFPTPASTSDPNIDLSGVAVVTSIISVLPDLNTLPEFAVSEVTNIFKPESTMRTDPPVLPLPSMVFISCPVTLLYTSTLPL